MRSLQSVIMPKVKCKGGGSNHQSKLENCYCIIHFACLKEHGPFIPFSSIQGDPSQKLVFLNAIRDSRLCEPLDSVNRYEDACELLPHTLTDLELRNNAGYHRKCYSRFTGNSNRLKNSPQQSSTSTQTKHHSPRKRSSSGETIFPPTCIFCEKEDRWVPYKRATERPQKFAHWVHKESGWMRLASHAEELGDTRLFRLVKDEYLHARLAMYHPSCYGDLCGRISNFKRKEAAKNMSNPHQANTAHIEAFAMVKAYLEDQELGRNEIVCLSSLCAIYIQELEHHGSPNPNYRAEKLLARLRQDEMLSKNLTFSKLSPENRGCITYWLIYRADITTTAAIARVYKLACSGNIKDVGLQLRAVIERAFKSSKELTWPPTIHDIPDPKLPEDLQQFLSYVLDGQEANTCGRTQCLMLSIGQDICRATTAGQWKMPKHILLCTTIVICTVVVNSSPF